MRKNLIPVMIMAVGLSACVTTEQQTAWQQQGARPMTCREGQDCAIKWGKALRWVQANSAYKLRMVNDSIIATMGPLPYSPQPAMEITKTPIGNGIYQIQFAAGCDNFIECLPNPYALKADLVQVIMGGTDAHPRSKKKSGRKS